MSTTESGTLLSARDLVKVYGSGPTAVDAVRGVSLDLRAGELVLVMGPSGSGKTLLSMLGGLLRPTSGAIEIGGTDTARQIGFVFQAFNLLASLTAKENIMFPARLAAVGHRAARARAEALLERLGLTERRHALPRSLSGGEKQRVAIARALINEASIILADEPTGNLDSERGQEVVMILHDLARDEGRSVLIVTHDPRVEDVADRILWLEDGSLRDRKRERRAWARDPVCGMRVDAMSAAFSAERGAGERAVFCSRRCLERFNEDPARFVSVADGAVLPPGTPLRSGG
jgi:putative ABC transport system ATP-binding protein